jgi:glyoxylase-like metal-dependent hydrolase (beta-lactamase superfamily II)
MQMDDFELSSKELGKGTWLINSDGCSCYVLIGDQKALMIDTGYGVYDIRAYAEKTTGRSIPWAANTHGHFDHAGGNGFFEKTFLSVEGDKIARVPYPSFKGHSFKLDYPAEIIEDGFIIDLGNRSVEAISIPCHDPSSLAFLDVRERLLFTGDEVSPHVPLLWQRADIQPSVEQYVSNMEKLMTRRDEFDYICSGHGEGLLAGSYVDKCLACAKNILAGFDGEQIPPPKTVTWEEWNKTKKGPRPGDLVIYDPQYKYAAEYDGVTIMYDIRYKNKRN